MHTLDTSLKVHFLGMENVVSERYSLLDAFTQSMNIIR